MALGRLPPAHLAACGCTQIGQIWIGSAALVPKQDRRQNGGYLKSPAKSASGQGVCGGDMSPPNGTCETRNIKSGSEKGTVAARDVQPPVPGQAISHLHLRLRAGHLRRGGRLGR